MFSTYARRRTKDMTLTRGVCDSLVTADTFSHRTHSFKHMQRKVYVRDCV